MDAASLAEPFRFTVDAHGGASSGPAAEVALARETRREIQRLVREISSLCHSRTPQHRFWPKFLSLVGTAMASDGGVLWERVESGWIATSHVGQIDSRILSPDPTHLSSHNRLVAEVGSTAGAVIVPPDAPWDLDEPGNPTDRLAAVVPVPVDPDEPVQWIVEQFLPPGGGPATVRGYLRFVAQMADLAAEYLRAERLREYRQRAEWSHRLQAMLADLYSRHNSGNVPRSVVDMVADLVAAERVSLVRRIGGKYRVVAVSGIDEIDSLSPAVAMIAEVAAQSAASPGFLVASPSEDSSPGVDKNHVDEAMDDADSRRSRGDDAETVIASGELVLRGVAVLDPSGDCRLVVEDRVDAPSVAVRDVQWPIVLRHISLALDQHERTRRGPLSQWFSPTNGAMVPSPMRRAVLWVGVLGVFVIAGWLPFPMVVTAQGRLEPTSTQTVFAPHDGIVADLWVQHGSHVQAGDPLLRLFDARLERNLQTLASRCAALTETIRGIERQLARDGSKDREQAERLQAQGNLTRDELAGAAAELEILRAQEEAMLVRATCDGVVEGWQARERLENRPVNRGQTLLRVVSPDALWQVQADIPQNRVNAVLAAQRDGRVTAEIVVQAFPDEAATGHLEEVGPIVPASIDADAYGVALFSVDEQALPIKQAGAPVEIAIDCGSRSLGYIAVQDLVRMIQRTVRLYW